THRLGVSKWSNPYPVWLVAKHQLLFAYFQRPFPFALRRGIVRELQAHRHIATLPFVRPLCKRLFSGHLSPFVLWLGCPNTDAQSMLHAAIRASAGEADDWCATILRISGSVLVGLGIAALSGLVRRIAP